MSSSLHYVTPLQLSDTFNEWFLRSNSLIDVVNKINVYNVENGWGLSRYRGIDGTTVLRLNIGQAENEYDSSAAASDYTFGLRFIDDGGTTGAANPDVSTTRKILTLDIENLPLGTGGSVDGAYVNEEDYFVYSDTSSGTGSIVKVKAGDALPYGISGDHRFYGNVYFDGTNTTINSSELNIDDLAINLATSNTGDGPTAYLNDANLDGAGLIIKGSSGDKQFVYDYYDAGSTAFSSFKPNVDLQISESRRILSEVKTLDLMSIVDDNFDIALTQLNDTTNIWKIRKNNLSDAQGRLIFLYENTISGVTQDAVSLSKAGTVQVSNIGLEGGFTADGIYYDSTFSYLPKSYGVPTTGMSGDVALHYKWTNRKLIHQTAHGFTSGDLLRYYPYGTTYDLSWKADKESAEVIAIVESDNGGSADSFVAVYNGLVDLSDWVPDQWATADGTTMEAGQVYFLGGTAGGSAEGFTADPPVTSGEIKKPVLLAIGEREALFVNYLGHEVSTSDVESSATGDYVFAKATGSENAGYLVLPSVVPNQAFKNKIINGDFSFWQRAEDGAINGSGASGAIDWDGTTGARFVNDSSTNQYTADMWMLDTRLGTKAEVQKLGLTADDANTADPFTTAPLQYVRVLNNDDAPVAKKSYFTHRIEDVRTLAPNDATVTNKVNVSYMAKAVTAGTLPVSYVTLHQVFDGNSGDNTVIAQSVYNAVGDYGGGSTFCLGDDAGTTLPNGVTLQTGADWVQGSATFIISGTNIMLNTSDAANITGGHDPENSWLELRFEIPSTFGVSGGFDLTRVQLEGGDTRTDFEQRPFQVEEQLVNRYYQRHTVGTDAYAMSGVSAGVFEQWKTLPYPYDGNAFRDDLNLSCSSAFNITNTNCAVAATTDVVYAKAGKGFKTQRPNSSGGPATVSMYGTYHFDFSINV